MNISKTLFKTLSRCPNAPALYEMYKNKNLHEVKEINGISLKDIKEELSKISDDAFDDTLSELEEDIFASMFDSDTGEDLTIVTSAQLEAFRGYFTLVESLAAKYIEKLFKQKVISSKNTFEQKKYEYYHNGNKYYCYLDIYTEEGNKIKVFEVKATTSSKFDDLHVNFKKGKGKYPLFEMNDQTKIMEYIGNSYLNQVIDETYVTEELLDEKIKTTLSRYSDCGKYLYDVSIERHIIEESFKSKGIRPKDIDYYLVILNHNYIYDGKVIDGNRVYDTSKDNEELFKIYDVNTLTEKYQKEILEERALFDKSCMHLVVMSDCLGNHCRYKKNDQCKFFNICHKNVLNDGSILEYTGKHYCFKSLTDFNKQGKRKTIDMYDLINKGIYTMKDAAPYIEGIDQQIELDCVTNNTQYFDKDNLKFLISKITYPIFHLDFESYNCPLPRFFGERPYTQSLFQYSLHIEKSPFDCDLERDHLEYLAPDHLDHRRDLAERLVHDIDLSNGGTTLAYHAVFEKTRIKELAHLYPDLSEKLMRIHDSIFDLEDVIHAGIKTYQKYDPNYDLTGKPKFNFYDKNLHASFSIKKVLPIFTNLTYQTLNVKNGTEAILAYGMLEELTDKEYEEKYESLRVYCRQDTWSMVKILQGLIKAIK